MFANYLFPTIAKRGFSHLASRDPALKLCPKLAEATPKLQALFDKLANNDGVLPLLSKKVNESFWKHAKKTDRLAAILVPVVSFEGVPSLLFTTRASHLSTHASQVSFPGGHFDEGDDTNLEDTALREAQEELLGNYPWQDVVIIGHAAPLPSFYGTPVTPVIAVLPYEISSDTFPGQPDEVEDVFCVSLSELVDIEETEQALRFAGKLPVFPAGDHRIWGLTAFVTSPLLRKLFKPIFLEGVDPKTKGVTTGNSRL